MKTMLLLSAKRLAISVSSCAKIFWPLFLGTCFTFILLKPRSMIMNSRKAAKTEPCPIHPKFSLVMTQEEMNQVMVERHWPLLRGYERLDATAEDHPVDYMLLDRILLDQRMMRTPRFEVVTEDVGREKKKGRDESLSNGDDKDMVEVPTNEKLKGVVDSDDKEILVEYVHKVEDSNSRNLSQSDDTVKGERLSRNDDTVKSERLSRSDDTMKGHRKLLEVWRWKPRMGRHGGRGRKKIPSMKTDEVEPVPEPMLKHENLPEHSKFPRVIHQIWKDENSIPEKATRFVGKWKKLNPEWTYILWTDQSAREFVEEYFRPLLGVYDGWRLPVQKADMLRILVLYAFGGVYVDIDMEPLKPLEEIRDWGSCILSKEPDMHSYVVLNDTRNFANNRTLISNAFLACTSHHPFLHYLISRLTKYSPIVTGKNCPISETSLCTGRTMMSISRAFYQRSLWEGLRTPPVQYDVIIADAVYFQPTFDNSYLVKVDKLCKKFHGMKLARRKVCRKWQDEKFNNGHSPESFMRHHWFRSYLFKFRPRELVKSRVDKNWKPVIWSKNKDMFSIHYSVEIDAQSFLS